MLFFLLNINLLIVQIPSDTGVGDFGAEGIASFVEDHSCNTICLGLGLNNQIPQVDSDDEEEGDKNDNVEQGPEDEEMPEGQAAEDA